ncbi:MAG: VapE domain-containing protein [Pseudomonadota bacterium]
MPVELPKSLGNAARGLANYGLRVFPLQIEGKLPMNLCDACLAPLGKPDESVTDADGVPGPKTYTCKSCGHVHTGKRGLYLATRDVDQIRKWWDKYPDANIGIATGEGIIAIDIDGEAGVQTWKNLIELHGEPDPTQEQRTGRGRHLIFKVDTKVKNRAGRLGAGIDTRGDGGYIVAGPSKHPNGSEYTWVEGRKPSQIKPIQCPEWILERLSDDRKTISEQAAVAPPIDELQTTDFDTMDKYVAVAVEGEYQRVCTAPAGQRNDQLNTSSFSLGTLVGAGILDERFVIRTMQTAATQNGLTASDGPQQVHATIMSGVTAGKAQPRNVQLNPQRNRPERRQFTPQIVGGEPDPERREQAYEVRQWDLWDDEIASAWINDEVPAFDRTTQGTKRRNSVWNAEIHFKHEKAFAGMFFVNSRNHELYFNRPPPWHEVAIAEKVIEEMKVQAVRSGENPDRVNWYNPALKQAVKDRIERETEENYPMACNDKVDRIKCDSQFNRRGLGIGKDNLFSMMLAIGYEDLRDPVKDALEDLVWDRTPRLDAWLVDYLKAENTELNRQFGSKWIISAVARIMKPGEKVDTMLVLEGPQGARKSTALRVLADGLLPGQFNDGLPAMGTKDAAIGLFDNVIIEIAELDAMYRSSKESTKAFLSRSEDKLRLPYDRGNSTIPRGCVFAGTVNPGGSGYLKDETGARRFWPVEIGVTGNLNISGLEDAAPQLWAEALVRYKSKEKWYLDDPKLIAQHQAKTEERTEEDPWAKDIDDHIRGQIIVFIDDILLKLDVPKDKRDLKHSRRIGSHLRMRGFKHQSVRIGDFVRKGYKRSEPWFPDDPDTDPDDNMGAFEPDENEFHEDSDG